MLRYPGKNFIGICNTNNGTISGCYNTGDISGTSNVGGICGINNGTITNCYYLTGCAKDGSNKIQYGIGNATQGSATEDTVGKTAAEFADGTIAWLLNTAGSSSAHSGVWSQGEKSPVFADETHIATYKLTISGAKIATYYTEAAGKCAALETLHGEGINTETVHSSDTSYTADAAITGVTPTVTDSISFAYDVTVAKDLTPTLTVTLGSKTVTLTATAPTGSGEYRNYSFVFEGTLPQQMTENISAMLMIDGTEYAKNPITL